MSVVTLLLLLLANANAASPNFAEQMKQTPCALQVKAHLAEKLQRQTWYPQSASEPWMPQMNGIMFRDSRSFTSYHIFSDKEQTWLKETSSLTGLVTIHIWDARKACLVRRSAKALKPANSPHVGFTDGDLRSLIEKHKWGLIYVWSPYMPNSVAGLKDIRQAAAEKDAYLTILLDGNANPVDAKKWLNEGAVTAADLTPVTSLELESRGLSLHYPITFIYKSKFISNRTYVGKKSPAAYQKWISLELAEIDRDLKI